MAAKLTKEVVESYLHCKFKGHLKQAGQQGSRSDYEALLIAAREEVKERATTKILAHHKEGEVARDLPLTTSALKKGPAFILDAILETDTLALKFDGLKRIDGSSKLGDFHYVPVLFHEGEQVRKEQRLLLEVYGLLLSRVQGRMPGSGVVWHGKEVRGTKVRLSTDSRKAERLLEELRDADPPRLLLNDHCQQCEFRQRCRAQAVQEDNLSLLRGMGEKEVKGYARKGILTLTQLAHTFRPRRKGKRQVRKTHHRYHALQALAIRDKRIYVFGTPEVRDSPVRIYLDMEGKPDEGFVYLIGMTVVQGGTETRHSFWADNKDQERDIFERFLAEVSRYDDFLVFCYGGYERAFLKRMRKAAKTKKQVDRVLERLVNILSLVYAHLYFPTYSNGLKEVAGCLGYSWSEADASGLQSLVWRARWEATHTEEWKGKLTMYNLEDCDALRRVTELVYAVCSKTPATAVTTAAGAGSMPVARVQDIDRWANDRKWGRVNFVHPDFEHINNCAYFDYQRERVYVRTSRRIKRSQRKQAESPNRHVRAYRQIRIVSRSCPKCKGEHVVNGIKKEVRTREPRVKRTYDLVFTPGRIKRQAIECRTTVHRCQDCGEEFVPEQHQRLDKHRHGLKSWAMYQHVAHRLSLRTIQIILEEFFGLRVHSCEMLMLKSLMARFYRGTYDQLLGRILGGHLLHVDETEVQLQTGKGYVWVFTNLEEVVFMYRPTREGDFLKELLKDFRGVLVSDFYAAYDSIDCPQQKCLIHLMRDMNQELLNNPFDEELRSVTGAFGTLLRAVVATVDECGLKRRHLHRHAREVSNYFRLLSEQTFRSEAAEGLRGRLLKYQDKLFTFIGHDGVPWNNNNAENAIKQFAYYREDTVGCLKENGLEDYLLLLSIYQTCRYKGASFLRFLLSREKDVDVFCQRKRRKVRPSVIEMYPEGFIPPHFRNRGRKPQNEGPRGPNQNLLEEPEAQAVQASSGQPPHSDPGTGDR